MSKPIRETSVIEVELEVSSSSAGRSPERARTASRPRSCGSAPTAPRTAVASSTVPRCGLA